MKTKMKVKTKTEPVTSLNGGTLHKIMERAQRLCPEYHTITGTIDMEVANTHLPLDLNKLLVFSEKDFIHDVFGIAYHVNRVTGKVMGHFLPKCAKSWLETHPTK